MSVSCVGGSEVLICNFRRRARTWGTRPISAQKYEPHCKRRKVRSDMVSDDVGYASRNPHHLLFPWRTFAVFRGVELPGVVRLNIQSERGI